jgi:hypothetical protein
VHGTALCDEILRLIDDILCGPDINRRESCQTGDNRNGGSLRPLRERKRSQRGIAAGTGQLASLALSRTCPEHRTSSDRVMRPSC